MLEYLTTQDDALAFRIGGKVGPVEFEDLVERVERSLQANPKTHMYMEVVDFTGFDLSAYLHYLPRGLAMLGKLDRFGRIAVVADQRWIRAWTKIESALLPGIRYEAYRPDERDIARDWVEGRRESPHEPSVRFIETDNPDVVAFELNGKLRGDEIEAIAGRFNPAMEGGGPIDLLGRIKRVDGVELAAIFNSDYLEMKLRGLRSVGRFALVGGPDWLSRWVAFIDPLVRIEIRHFAADEEAGAWQWLGANPTAEAKVATARPVPVG